MCNQTRKEHKEFAFSLPKPSFSHLTVQKCVLNNYRPEALGFTSQEKNPKSDKEFQLLKEIEVQMLFFPKKKSSLQHF